MRYLATAALLFAGIVHLLPLVGILGPERLSALYGISVSEPNLEILLRHRAVLFGLLGAFLVYASFSRHLLASAMVAGVVSAGSFVVVALLVGEYNSYLSKVVLADVASLAALLLGGTVSFFAERAA